MERSHGTLYDRLSSCALSEIVGRMPSGGSIVDFGAGCGRLTLPLAERGYRVTAVEPSEGMATQLRCGVSELSPESAAYVTVTEASMQAFRSPVRHDLALCVFTVIAYLLDRPALSDALTSAALSLRRGGLFLIDVPHETVFTGFDHEDAHLIRSVDIDELGNGQYQYTEHTIVRTTSGRNEYRDSFRLRHWSVEDVVSVLEETGFTVQADVADHFAGLGAHYLLMRKV